MVIEMNDSKLATLAQIREFLADTADVGLQPMGRRAQRHALVQATQPPPSTSRRCCRSPLRSRPTRKDCG
jgi:hypothetical protein